MHPQYRAEPIVWLLHLCSLTFQSVLADVSGSCAEDLKRCSQDFESQQSQIMQAVKQMSQQLCSPCMKCENKSSDEWMESKAELDKRSKQLIAALTTSENLKQPALVLLPEISTNFGASVNFSCESPTGQSVSLCLWEYKINEERQVVLMDEEVVQNSGETSMEGISFAGEGGLEGGKCGVKIDSTTENHFGSWTCTLVSESNEIFTGEVKVKEGAEIYFAVWGGSVRAYSMATSQVNTILNSSSYTVLGITHDSMRKTIYWSGDTEIFRANVDGSQNETVWNAKDSRISPEERAFGLAYDWISGNIYAATDEGRIVACEARLTESFACATVLSGQGPLQGISLDPVDGTMYFSRTSPGSILKAGMDGTNPAAIVSALKDPIGMAIDFEFGQLYWADREADRIQRSDLEGHGVETVLQLPVSSSPWGIMVVHERIYWSSSGFSERLASCNKYGTDVRTHFIGDNWMGHIALVPDLNLPKNRTNHCAGQKCAKVCVLTRTSFRCVA